MAEYDNLGYMECRTKKVSELRIGMRVTLPASWFKHPFLTNEFVISSEDQIRKIIDSGFDEVVAEDYDTASSGGEAFSAPEVWRPEELVPAELREAICSNTLTAEKKAAIVYKSSLTLMQRLLEDPKAENIHAAKDGIAQIVDFILSDDATSKNLLTITNCDFYTYTHSVNVGVLSVLLSKALFKGSTAHDMQELGAGFFLHDIGKVRIDQQVLNKPARLTEEEMRHVRTHPYQGYKILSETEQLSEECRIIVMQHHERADGTGYPRHLSDDEIHIYGRICSLADIYDALTAERPYKKRMKPFEALQLMKDKMLNHFHKDLFDEFVLLFS